MSRIALLIILACFCTSVPLPTAAPADATTLLQASTTLVKDINTGPGIGYSQYDPIFSLSVSANRAYFSEYDPENGYELWMSDGTSAGTQLLRDLNPGPAESRPTNLIDLNGNMLFSSSYLSGLLWKSDGTAAGTQLLLDSQSGKPLLVNNEGFFRANNRVFFRSNSSSLGTSDGTSAGTQVLHVWPSIGELGRFTSAQGKVFFFITLSEGTNNSTELWQSDGSVAGTQRVKTITTSSSSLPNEAVAVGNVIFFRIGTQLWRSNGTESGTQPILTLLSSTKAYLVSYAGMLYYHDLFNVLVSSPSQTYELHNAIFRLAPDSTTPELFQDSGEVSAAVQPSLASIASYFFFYANDGLTFTDGIHSHKVRTADGSTLSLSLSDLGVDGHYALGNGWLFVGAINKAPEYSQQLDVWAIDLATGLAHPIYQTVSDDYKRLGRMALLGNQLLFSTGTMIWSSDGSAAGTKLLYQRPIPEQGIQGNSRFFGSPMGPHLGDRVFLCALDSDSKIKLWVSDGTQLGTHVLKADISLLNPLEWRSWNGAVYFPAYQGDKIGLWKSDGTEQGTVPLTQFSTSTRVYHLVEMQQSIYFFAGVAGDMHIWKTDGSEAGTQAVATVPSYQNVGYGLPGTPEVVGDRMFFTARQQETGYELWVSDGSQAGTHITKDINPGSYDVSIHGLTAVGERAFFLEGLFMSDGYNLWVSDGTEAGTILVKKLGPIPFGLDSPVHGQMLDLQGKAFFSGWDDSSWVEPWISDGTPSGTQLVKDINQHTYYSQGKLLTQASLPNNMAILNGKVLFSADDGIHGTELWVSDGNASGTQLLVDLNPGPIGSAPSAVTSFGSFAIFAASNGPNGVEVWRTDGTAAGTWQLADIAAGPGSSNAYGFNLVGEKLFLLANDGSTGQELHMLDLTQLAEQRYRVYLPGVAR